MVIERVAKSGARVAGTGIGSTIGGFLTSPFGLGILGVAALVGGLFVFRDKISEFFQNALKIPDININLPDLPTLPDLPPLPTLPPNILCTLFGIGCDEPPEEPIESSEGLFTQEERDLCQCGTSIVQDASGLVTETCITCQPPPPPNPMLDEEPSDAELFAMDFPEPFVDPPPPPPEPDLPPVIVDPFLETEGEFMGGGSGFIGGSIGQTPITTLFQVLDLFSGFSASQAANFLFQFSGISPEEALNLDQFKQFQ